MRELNSLLESDKRRDPGIEVETMYEKRIGGFSLILYLRCTQQKNNEPIRIRSNFSFHFPLSNTSDIEKYQQRQINIVIHDKQQY